MRDRKEFTVFVVKMELNTFRNLKIELQESLLHDEFYPDKADGFGICVLSESREAYFYRVGSSPLPPSDIYYSAT